MIITNINLTLPGHGYAMFNNHPLYVTRKQYEPSDMLYLTYFDNFVNGYDTPFICTDPEYKWNASTYWTSNTITSVDGTLPETYIGQKYVETIGNRLPTDILSIPGIEEGVTSFNMSFWTKCTYQVGAGAAFGVRAHSNANTMYTVDISNAVTNRDYGFNFYSPGAYTRTFFNGSSVVRDNCPNSCVSRSEWHHYAYEWDQNALKLYVFSDGLLRVVYDFVVGSYKHNGYSTCGDGASYAERFTITEVCFRPGLLHTGEGNDARYPVPTVPIKNSL